MSILDISYIADKKTKETTPNNGDKIYQLYVF